MIQRATFIHLNPIHAKADKHRENETKKGESETKSEQKRVISHTLDIKFIE